MTKIRVNVTTAVNMAAIRKDKRNGRDIIIVPSATLPDNIIMNEIKYPSDEIAKSFGTLERTPAPFGHPKVGNSFVSASDPEGINIGWIGAWNENVRQSEGRVLIDKIIDVEIANQSENGRAVLAAIEAGEPIHTSTGLDGILGEPDGDDHKHTISNMVFDHDAILLNVSGAATPSQGVGMMVNADGEEIDVINSTIEQDFDQEVEWAVDQIVRAAERAEEREEHNPLAQRIKAAILKAFGQERETPQQNESEETMDDAKFNELSDQVKAIGEAQASIGETIANTIAEAMKPLTDAHAATVANAAAADKAELDALTAKIVASNLMNEEAAAELTLNAARALAPKADPKKAQNLNAAFNSASDDTADEFADVDLNAAYGEEKA